jgi:hypothetical protein
MRLGRFYLLDVRFLDVLVGVTGFRCGRYGAMAGRCSHRRWCRHRRWRRSRGLRKGDAGKQGGDQGGDDFLHDVKSLK